MKDAFEKIKERLATESDKWLNIWNDASKEGTIDNYADGMNDGFDEALSIVSEVEAEYGNGWIPCSEKMPEQFVHVLVWFEYFRYGEYNRLFQTHGISYTYKGEWSGFVNGSSGWKQLRILAWMPLPEPYKTEK